MRLSIALPLAFAASLSAPLAVHASSYRGAEWIPSPRDSAEFGRVRRAGLAADRIAEQVAGDARARAAVRRRAVLAADSLAARFGGRLASRVPADSVAMAQLLLLRFDLRHSSLGMVDSLTREVLWEGAHLLERQLGPEHPGLVAALSRLAFGYERTQNLRRLTAVSERWVALLERQSPPDSLELARALATLSRGHVGLGDYARALSAIERAVALQERVRGAASAGAAGARNDLAMVYLRQSRLPEALAEYQRILAIRLPINGPNSTQVAQTLHNIGSVELRLDRTDEAREHVRRAVAIWERPEHNTDSNVAAGYTALGEIARRTGDYEEARRWLERGLLVRRRSLAPGSPSVASAIENVAGLLEEMGDYAAALPKRQEALRIRERAQGGENAETAQAMDAMARLLVATGRAGEALELSAPAIAIREKALGESDPGLVRLLNTHGDALRALDRTTDALASYRRAERVLAASPMAAGSERATVLRRIGQAQIALAQPASAESSYAEGLAVARRTLGESHPLAIDLLDDLAHAQRDLGRSREALATALEAERRGRERFVLQAPALSEREALRYSAVRPTGLPLAIGLAAAGADPARVHEVWDALLRQRAQVLDEIGERHRALRRAEAPEVDSLRRVFAEASRQLGGVLARGAAGDSSWTARVEAARARLERAEAALGARSRAFRDQVAIERAGFAAVAAALPEGTALVGYTRYALSTWKDGRRGLDDRIAAFVLRRGERPEVVAVGATADVDSLCRAWRSAMRPLARGEDASAREREARAAGAALRRLAWDPVAGRIGRARRVFVVPEGDLHLVNLAALPAADGHYLLERGFEFHMLATERDLLIEPAQGGRGMLALGGVSFDASESMAVPDGGAMAAADPVAPAWRGPLAACASFRDIAFAALPATASEAERVAALWVGDAREVVRLEGAAASEAAVKRLAPGRRVVHLATHGFFVDPRCGSGAGGGRGIGGLAPADTSATAAAEPDGITATEREPDGLEHPLRLSGLALAGANRRSEAKEGEEDGVLTAEELAALDLSGVEWVVLSACETGIGSVDAGEGVFGLRRAVHTAGAHTLISSLWSVEDASAARWMEALYRRRLGGREDTVASVHGASLDELTRRRRSGESTHPFHWAGFVAAGDWR